MRHFLALMLHCLLVHYTIAQLPTPAPAQSRPIVITRATVHTGTGAVLPDASVRFAEGIITHVGASVPTEGAEIIDAKGQDLYPGLTLLGTVLGITEIASVRPTRDYEETGAFNPEARTLIAYNTDSDIPPTLRANGILFAQPTPRGTAVAGQSSLMELDGWNWEDAAHTPDEGIHLYWVRMFTRGGWMSDTPGRIEKNERRNEALRQLQIAFEEARAYHANPTPTHKNLKFEAMRGLFEGSKNLYLHANYHKEIVEGVQFLQALGVKKIVVMGGADALAVADFLREHQIPVVLDRLHRLPSRPEEGVWYPYQLPMLLHQKGITVALGYDVEDDNPMGCRNLPFTAGTAVAYGLDREAALQMITLNPAKIIGVHQKIGSIEVGKQASMVLSTGDLLDMRSNQVVQAFIRGKRLELDDKHKYLYRRYKQKYQK